MIDHISIRVRDFDASKAFYLQALKPLGYELIVEFDGAVGGFGRDGKPDFWIAQDEGGSPIHVAFASDDRATVEAFHAAAIAAGGKDNGGPGIREEYSPTYYGAFVFDPDGNNVETVCHSPA